MPKLKFWRLSRVLFLIVIVVALVCLVVTIWGLSTGTMNDSQRTTLLKIAGIPGILLTIPALVLCFVIRHEEKWQKMVCQVCGYVYDPAVGDPDMDIKPGTRFDKVHKRWVCPDCGAWKSEFKPREVESREKETVA